MQTYELQLFCTACFHSERIAQAVNNRKSEVSFPLTSVPTLKMLLDYLYHAGSIWIFFLICICNIFPNCSSFSFIFFFYLYLQVLHSAKNHLVLNKSAQCIHFNIL